MTEHGSENQSTSSTSVAYASTAVVVGKVAHLHQNHKLSSADQITLSIELKFEGIIRFRKNQNSIEQVFCAEKRSLQVQYMERKSFQRVANHESLAIHIDKFLLPSLILWFMN